MHTHLLLASRKRGSTRAETEYRVVISGGQYGVSTSLPPCKGAASTSVSAGTVKERSLWSFDKIFRECRQTDSNVDKEFLESEPQLYALWIFPVNIYDAFHAPCQLFHSYQVVLLLHCLEELRQLLNRILKKIILTHFISLKGYILGVQCTFL